MISQYAHQVLAKLADAAHRVGRNPKDISIVAVSKRQPIEKMAALQAAFSEVGRNIVFGESRVQEFKKKLQEFPRDSWTAHLVGALQRNKAKDAVALFDLIESVHDPSIARAVHAAAEKLGTRQAVFLQVNISGDEQKSGFSPSNLEKFIADELPKLPMLTVEGLMTITRFFEAPEEVRPDFRQMYQLYQHIRSLPTLLELSGSERFELSMGMSRDFDIAVEEGATVVRIGTALFGSRE